jgi:serine/threonine protein kinase/formylglycine-generating enzyme required for sulfatase activity
VAQRTYLAWNENAAWRVTMSNERHVRVKELYLRASKLPVGERKAFLDLECAKDASIRAEVERMLAFEEQQPGFLDEQVEEGQDPQMSAGTEAMLQRLEQHGGRESRYEVIGEFARGGMGAILRVRDHDLGRTLAMKVVLGQAEAKRSGDTPSVDEKTLGRFLEEAQITGQLDHPGIVPVHELGLDAKRQVYFTMKLVQGSDLKAIFDLVRTGVDGWNQTRALGVLLKVCEAMSYAHTKQVIHRDLKPANIMVGKFGEVYVMDWGLAYIAGQEDKQDIRIRKPEVETLPVRTDRHEDLGGDSPLLTMDGDVVGTPAFMSPEQARGAIAEMGPTSDVYAVGAILYELLVGHMPYVPTDARLNAYAVWALVQQSAPTPVAQLAPKAPEELVAICERAMQRDAADRYADMGAMADDLRAFLEGRVVSAHRTGMAVVVQKWIARNRMLSMASVIAIAGFGSSLFLRSQSQLEQRITERLTTMAEHLSYVPSGESISYERQADTLWPPHPEKIEEMEAWLEHASALVSHLPRHRARLDALAARELTDPLEQWELDALQGLVGGLERLESGLLSEDHVVDGFGWSVPKRLRVAKCLRDGLADGGEWDERWVDAIEGIRQEPIYGGMLLKKQTGLVPIGQDEASGLWEFWHVASGDEPIRDDGYLDITGKSGIVLTLIPSGRFLMGAQSSDPTGDHYDPDPVGGQRAQLYPVHEVKMEAYFISKYEMTQGQWLRVQGGNPSMDGDKAGNSKKRPVNLVSPLDCDQACYRLGLVLPHEQQWEYAARAGTDTLWWTGDDLSSVRESEYISDPSIPAEGLSLLKSLEVDALVGNPWGLHHVHGNLVEWCSNAPYDYWPGGNVADPRLGIRSARGGSFRSPQINSTRVAFRGTNAESFKLAFIGLRPAREIEK